MKTKFVVLSSIFLVIAFKGICQIPKDLHLELSSSDVKKLEKCSEQYKEAKKLFEKAVSLYESLPEPDTSGEYDVDLYNDRLKEAFNTLFNGSDFYLTTTEQAYSVYKKGADDFWEKQKKEGHVPIGLEKARYLELEGNIAYDKAIIRRQFARESSDFLEAISYVNKANKLEAEALQNLSRAMQIYQDFPVEYDYEWTNDIDIEEILAQKKAERDARNEKLFGKHKKEPKKNEAIIEREQIKPEKPVGEVVYRVQIAANTVPLKMEFLKKMYNGDKEIDEVQEDEWFRYHIGKYTTFSEAQSALAETRVERAFIVAYLDGERINVKEARKIAP